MSSSARPRWWRRRVTKVLGGSAAVLLLLLIVAAEYLLHHLEPLVRARAIQTLSESFDSPVELDRLHISLLRGIEVQGEGLRIPYGYAARGNPPRGLLLNVQRFRFRTSLPELLRDGRHVNEFVAEGIEIHIPPHGLRGALPGARSGSQTDSTTPRRLHARITFTASHIVNDNLKLFIEADRPGRDPLEFDVRHLDLLNVGADRAALYTADFTNAKPTGDIRATGHLGPWVSNDPRETPLDGDYTFTDADLGTIKGIGGTLQSAGHFSGQFERIAVDGTVDVPNFSLDTAHHPVPLHSRFHAFVDGTSGDTTLAPVQARLAHSDFTTVGKIVKVPGRGHDILLDVSIPGARVEDFLTLGVKTAPPLMTGTLRMKARLHIPPGPDRVPLKMQLSGEFGIRAVRFSNVNFQNRVDGLSARAQGHPEETKSVSQDRIAEAASQMSARFGLQHGLLTAEDVHYTVPGAVALMNGVYSMDGNVFEFKGHVRTDATASQMVGGWKGLLLLPFDQFLEKNGAGVELPIELSGTSGDVHFGLAMGGTDESTRTMAQDLKNQRQDPRHGKPSAPPSQAPPQGRRSPGAQP